MVYLYGPTGLRDGCTPSSERSTRGLPAGQSVTRPITVTLTKIPSATSIVNTVQRTQIRMFGHGADSSARTGQL